MKITLRIIALLCAMVLCAVAGCSASDSSDNSSAVSSKGSSSVKVPGGGTSSTQTSTETPSVISSEVSSLMSSDFLSSVSSAVSSKVSSSLLNSTVSRIPHTGNTINYLQNIIDDMTLPHEARPHGVPLSYNWSTVPREGMGTNPGSFTQMTMWGQVYEAAEGNPATNTRVQLRKLEAYYFSKKQQKWILLQSSSNIAGSAYTENFVGNANRPADKRDESSNGGGLSVKAGDGYNFHFWPDTGRANIDPTDIAVIYSTAQARLIVDNSSRPDDRASARYLLSIGGDYWRDQNAGWDNFKTNGDYAIGRFKYVTKEWQAFNGWAGDINILRNNPPPIQ